MNRFQMFVHPVVSVPKHSQHIFANDLVKEVISDVRSDVVKKMIMMPLLQTPETRLIQYDCGKLQVLVSFWWFIKGGLASECFSNLSPSPKKINQVTILSIFSFSR